MSAFGGKADMPLCESPLSRSLLGVKRTWLVATHMSASDPKRTCQHSLSTLHTLLRAKLPSKIYSICRCDGGNNGHNLLQNAYYRSFSQLRPISVGALHAAEPTGTGPAPGPG